MKIWRSSVLMAVVVAVMLVSGSMFSFASSPIKLFVNKQEIQSDVSPQIINDRVLVPIRWVSEALGADVKWNDQERSVYVVHQAQELAQQRIQLLEQFYAPASAFEAADMWANAVKLRNGAVQYSLLSTELQKTTVDEFKEWHWVPGVSSPWTESYTVTPLDSTNDSKHMYGVVFNMATSTGSAGSARVTITVTQKDVKWKINQIENEQNAEALANLVLP